MMLRRKQLLSQNPGFVVNLIKLKPGIQQFTAKTAEQQRRKLQQYKKLDAEKLKQDANHWIDMLINRYGDIETPNTSHAFNFKQIGELLRTRINEVEIGKPAPDIIGKDVDGNDFRLSSLKGKPVILTFAFCSTQAGRGLNRAQIKEKYGKQGVEIVSVVSFFDSQKENFLKEVEKEKPYATFVRDQMQVGPIRKSWGGGADGVFFIDRNGIIVHTGPSGTLDAAIEKTLNSTAQ